MKMARQPDPLTIWRNAFELSMMAAEAQSVIAMRLWGMAGIWSVTPNENTRMVAEKTDAVTRAVTQASMAAMRGQSPERVAYAAIEPMRRKTRANAKRLAKRGLKKSP